MENTTTKSKSYMVNDEMVNGLTPRERHIQAVGLFTLIIQLIVEAVQKGRREKGEGSKEQPDDVQREEF